MPGKLAQDGAAGRPSSPLDNEVGTITPMRAVLGAYGFGFAGVTGPLLDRFPSSWPKVVIRQELDSPPPVLRSLDDSRAEFPLLDGGSVVVHRDPPDGIYHLPHALSPDELAHPYLAPVAAVHAHWNGLDTFHAGGFVVNGRAWAILASKEGGKSSLLAALSVAGFDILSDDLTVTDGKRVFAGPRSIDLRRDAAAQFPSTRNLGVAGRRQRWRVDLGSVEPEVPLAGWLTLQWGKRLEAQRVEPADRFRMLTKNRSLALATPDPHRLLELVARTMWTITRPRGWDRMGQVLELISEKIG
jgi:hypothetical protein